MRSQRVLLLSVLLFTAMALGFAISSLDSTPVTQAAPNAPPRAHLSAISAAPGVTHTLFLPFIVRGCTTMQLLQDTGFEAGLTNAFWQTSSSQSSSILDNSSIPTPNPTHSGSWKAFLGGNNSISENLWQNVSVPAGTSSLSVSLWRRIDTTEPISTPTSDSLQIQVRDSVSNTLQTAYTLYNLDAGTTWVQNMVAISPTYASQNIQLAFVATTDNSFPTSFFIDDVTLSACH